jgi:hypothetical protein
LLWTKRECDFKSVRQKMLIHAAFIIAGQNAIGFFSICFNLSAINDYQKWKTRPLTDIERVKSKTEFSRSHIASVAIGT